MSLMNFCFAIFITQSFVLGISSIARPRYKRLDPREMKVGPFREKHINTPPFNQKHISTPPLESPANTVSDDPFQSDYNASTADFQSLQTRDDHQININITSTTCTHTTQLHQIQHNISFVPQLSLIQQNSHNCTNVNDHNLHATFLDNNTDSMMYKLIILGITLVFIFIIAMCYYQIRKERIYRLRQMHRYVNKHSMASNGNQRQIILHSPKLEFCNNLGNQSENSQTIKQQENRIVAGSWQPENFINIIENVAAVNDVLRDDIINDMEAEGHSKNPSIDLESDDDIVVDGLETK